MLRNSIALLICLCSTSVWSQFDPFKYVVVPVQFEAFKQANMHKTSTLIKYYLDQRGYPAVYDLGKPRELQEAPCMGVYTQFIDDSNLFRTRVILRFVDCDGKTVFETREGSSKEKEYKTAYKQAIEEVFASFDGMGYTYTPAKTAAPATAQAEASQPQAVPVQDSQTQATPVDTFDASTTSDEAAQKPDASVEGSQTAEMGAGSETRPEPQTPSEASAPELLYAQAIEGGFQLVDSSPKVRMLLLESPRGEDVYMAVVDGNSAGTVYRDGTTWIHEYFKDGEVVRTSLNIKF